MDYPKHISKKKRSISALKGVLSRFDKMGISIKPYYVFLEGLSTGAEMKYQNGLKGYEFVSLGPQDMREISSLEISDRMESEEYLLNRLKQGPRCFGLKQQGKVAAFTWYDLRQCNFYGQIFPLERSETCLLDAYTLKSFRGKGLAPYVRYQVYKELSRFGRDRLLSISDFSNASAVRFKRKLDAKLLELRLSVRFRGLRIDARIRSYGIDASRFQTLHLNFWLSNHKILEF